MRHYPIPKGLTVREWNRRLALIRPFSLALALLVCLSCGNKNVPDSTTAQRAQAIAGKDCDCPPSRFEKGPFYSQFYEDYILSYVLGDRSSGFYVDVGANDPMVNSVTQYFYERGWHGINIEPNKELMAEFYARRPRDINLNVGISDKEGSLTFYQVSKKTGLSTFDKRIADRLKKRKAKIKKIVVPVTTLEKVLTTQPVPAEITFLNVDVEGFELEVLQGIDFSRHQPVVVCVEAGPGTAVHGHWENLMLKGGYIFALFDGLNRYYLHKNHLELLDRFVFIDMCVKMSKSQRHVRLDGYSSWDN
jgi:FkbM family methyltransferase